MVETRGFLLFSEVSILLLFISVSKQLTCNKLTHKTMTHENEISYNRKNKNSLIHFGVESSVLTIYELNVSPQFTQKHLKNGIEYSFSLI